MTIKNVSRQCQIAPGDGGANSAPTYTNFLKINEVEVLEKTLRESQKSRKLKHTHMQSDFQSFPFFFLTFSIYTCSLNAELYLIEFCSFIALAS